MGIYVNHPAAVVTDPRATELRELAAVEGSHIHLSIDVINMVLWLEDRGFIMDLRTRIAYRIIAEDDRGMDVAPSGRAVNHLLSPVTAEECAPDGTLQAMVLEADKDERWYEAELQDLRDGRDEEEFNRRGC